MTRKFVAAPGPHAPQLAVEAHDLSTAEYMRLRSIVTNQYMFSADYRYSKPASAFLQGEQPPFDENDGWILIEFWTRDRKAIDDFVAYINSQMEAS